LAVRGWLWVGVVVLLPKGYTCICVIYLVVKIMLEFQDTMIFPNEGEWWGHFADGSMKTVLTMKVGLVFTYYVLVFSLNKFPNTKEAAE
jgi:hypothetical protein